MNDKVVILTGGAGLLGKQFTRSLLESGARVAVFDIASKKALAAIAHDLPEAVRAKALFLHVDITKPAQVKGALARVIKKFARVDVLVNNAALNPAPGSPSAKGQWGAYEHYPLDLWRRELEVNLTSMLIMTQAVAPHLIKQRSGSIINVASIYGFVAPDNRIYDAGRHKSIGYATSKGAVYNFTRTWAAHLGNSNVRVNCVTFGGVVAGQPAKFVKRYAEKTMLGRMARQDEYNGLITFLASDASSYVTGANFVADGGWSAW